MYYVAKVFSSSFTPIIVEPFDTIELATAYADIMNEAGKGKFIVLKPVINNADTADPEQVKELQNNKSTRV